MNNKAGEATSSFLLERERTCPQIPQTLTWNDRTLALKDIQRLDTFKSCSDLALAMAAIALDIFQMRRQRHWH